jgi:hypothetical protein
MTHNPRPCPGHNPQGCERGPHKCYLYLDHYGPCKAKKCYHEFTDVNEEAFRDGAVL